MGPLSPCTAIAMYSDSSPSEATRRVSTRCGIWSAIGVHCGAGKPSARQLSVHGLGHGGRPLSKSRTLRYPSTRLTTARRLVVEHNAVTGLLGDTDRRPVLFATDRVVSRRAASAACFCMGRIRPD